jgi:small-conductance mechanosensitive channel
MEEERKKREEEEKKQAEEEERRKLVKQMAVVVDQCLDSIRPICKMITEKIDAAERTPEDERDEEALVKEVRLLIEEGGRILNEAKAAIKGLDPDGRIAANAKHKTASGEASPEEYRLADLLKELTGDVTQCIENAKKKLEGMPHAKKELNPLWGLLNEPLFQILAAVGLLLAGVLNLVGRLLSGLGLGGIIDGLFGTLGLNRVLAGLGLGELSKGLKSGGKKKGGGLFGGILGG